MGFIFLPQKTRSGVKDNNPFHFLYYLAPTMALVNFTLKHPDQITTDTNLNWFALTEGEYWLDLNKATLYEYTSEVLTPDEPRHVEYQIASLIKEFTGLFEAIAEPVPDAFYAIAKENNYLYRFYAAAQNFLDNLSNNNDSDYGLFEKTILWLYTRTLTAPYLTGGPGISFFRNRDHISLVWNAEQVTENDIAIWTAQTGEIEMTYEKFVAEIEDFGHRFFNAMDTQVQLALEKDGGNKEQLIQEQQDQKTLFFQYKLAILKGEPKTETDWNEINSLITKMFS